MKQHTKYEKETVNYPLHFGISILLSELAFFLIIGWIGLAFYFFNNYHMQWNIFWGWQSLGGLFAFLIGIVAGGTLASNEEEEIAKREKERESHDH